jgi:hypothetical protein
VVEQWHSRRGSEHTHRGVTGMGDAAAAPPAHIIAHLACPCVPSAGLAKDRLPVVVSFESVKPMSFTANLDFMDEDGKRFSMPVTGTTDNSLLTHHAFAEVRC